MHRQGGTGEYRVQKQGHIRVRNRVNLGSETGPFRVHLRSETGPFRSNTGPYRGHIRPYAAICGHVRPGAGTCTARCGYMYGQVPGTARCQVCPGTARCQVWPGTASVRPVYGQVHDGQCTARYMTARYRSRHGQDGQVQVQAWPGRPDSTLGRPDTASLAASWPSVQPHGASLDSRRRSTPR